MRRTKFVKLDFMQLRWPEAEGPDRKASRHTGCPTTQGWTLPSCAIDPAILTVWPKEVVVLELKVTATVGTGVAHPLGTVVEVGLVDDVRTLLEVGGGDPVPVILMSVHVKYTCGV
jgi:hypothetical protein